MDRDAPLLALELLAYRGMWPATHPALASIVEVAFSSTGSRHG